MSYIPNLANRCQHCWNENNEVKYGSISKFLRFTVHGISNPSIRDKIKAKAFKGMPSFSNTTMANVMSNPGTVVLEKLSEIR